MIQRIQTLYLLIVTILQVILLFSNIAKIHVEGGGIMVLGILSADFWAIAAIVAINALLAFFTIFLYRRRVIQIRINIYNLILLLILQGYLVYYLIKLTTGSLETILYSIPTVFPFVSAIFTYLAIRNMIKDEVLIRTMDRIR